MPNLLDANLLNAKVVDVQQVPSVDLESEYAHEYDTSESSE